MRNFVNRKKEVDTLLTAFNAGKHLDIYGVAGIGKTELMRYLVEKITTKQLMSVYVSLDKVPNLQSLLEAIANKIDDESSGETPFFKFKEYINDHQEPDPTKVINRFSAAFYNAVEPRKILLCFDDSEKVNTEIWEQFEEEILRFHLGTGDGSDSNLKIITAGQRRMHWIFFRMREQTEPCRLTLFDRTTTNDMVRMLVGQNPFGIKNEGIALEKIHQLTQGHPESIRIVVQHWTNDYTQPLDGNVVDERYSEGVAKLLEQFVQPKFIAQLSELQEGEHYPDSKTPQSILQHLAPLRLMSSKVLREALRRLFRDFYQEKRPFFFDKLFRILLDAHLLEWHEDKDRYELSAIVRHLFLEDWRINKPKDLIGVHKQFSEMYQNLVEGSLGESQLESFIEKLYHLIESTTPKDLSKEKVSLEEKFRDEILHYAKDYGMTRNLLRQKLKSDSDLSQKLDWEFLLKSVEDELAEGMRHHA